MTDHTVQPSAPRALGPGDDDPRSPARDPWPLAGPLGPGDDDPRSAGARQTIRQAPQPLGPGDDDPRSPAAAAAMPAAPALGPGDATGPNPDDEFDFVAPPPPGPGGVATGPRFIVRIPKRRRETAAEQE